MSSVGGECEVVSCEDSTAPPAQCHSKRCIRDAVAGGLTLAERRGWHARRDYQKVISAQGWNPGRGGGRKRREGA